METKIVVTAPDLSMTYDHIDHYFDDGEFLTITCKYDFPNSINTHMIKINLRNIIGYTIMVSKYKEG